jgi:hypothetical protein
MTTPKQKYRRVWFGGDDPGVGFVTVDPPLLPGEVEIDLSDPPPTPTPSEPEHELFEVVMDDLLRTPR